MRGACRHFEELATQRLRYAVKEGVSHTRRRIVAGRAFISHPDASGEVMAKHSRHCSVQKIGTSFARAIVPRGCLGKILAHLPNWVRVLSGLDARGIDGSIGLMPRVEDHHRPIVTSHRQQRVVGRMEVKAHYLRLWAVVVRFPTRRKHDDGARWLHQQLSIPPRTMEVDRSNLDVCGVRFVKCGKPREIPASPGDLERGSTKAGKDLGRDLDFIGIASASLERYPSHPTLRVERVLRVARILKAEAANDPATLPHEVVTTVGCGEEVRISWVPCQCRHLLEQFHNGPDRREGNAQVEACHGEHVLPLIYSRDRCGNDKRLLLCPSQCHSLAIWSLGCVAHRYAFTVSSLKTWE